MMSVTIPRPVDGEFAPFYATYVNAVPEHQDPLSELERQLTRLPGRLATLSEEGALYRYEAGKWSIKEVIGHLSDAERVFSTRLLRVLRGDQAAQPGFDEGDYVEMGGFDRRPLEELLDEWRAVRNSMIVLVRSAGSKDWIRRGTVNGDSVTAAALAYIVAGHALHHERVLGERYGLEIGD